VGCRVWGVGYRVWGVGYRVWGVGYPKGIAKVSTYFSLCLSLALPLSLSLCRLPPNVTNESVWALKGVKCRV